MRWSSPPAPQGRSSSGVAFSGRNEMRRHAAIPRISSVPDVERSGWIEVDWVVPKTNPDVAKCVFGPLAKFAPVWA